FHRGYRRANAARQGAARGGSPPGRADPAQRIAGPTPRGAYPHPVRRAAACRARAAGGERDRRLSKGRGAMPAPPQGRGGGLGRPGRVTWVPPFVEESMSAAGHGKLASAIAGRGDFTAEIRLVWISALAVGIGAACAYVAKALLWLIALF